MLKRRFIDYIIIAVVLITFGTGFREHSIAAVAKNAATPAADVEVLESGPIHEAFAEAVSFDPEPGIVTPRNPPALIEEIPPPQKPAGDAQWIPGYWAWDDGRNDYIWVSGVWRVLPPGRQWVPGYWYPARGGYQWISGYWDSTAEGGTTYLPVPPDSLEAGPGSDAPSPDHIWIPGCWRWSGGRYAWGPGYWGPVRPNWIWVPPHYNWTPRGYIFVSGYWDYSVIHRGVLFAPVFFRPRPYSGWIFSYSPGVVISLSIFDDALFLRPRYRHYYYGDYYAPRYYQRGIYPWFSVYARRATYDPIYAHQRWQHRHDRGWEDHLEANFQKRRVQKAARPQPIIERRNRAGKVLRSPVVQRPRLDYPSGRTVRNNAGTDRLISPGGNERRDVVQRQNPARSSRIGQQAREARKRDMPAAKISKRPVANKGRLSGTPLMAGPTQKQGSRKELPASYRVSKPPPHVQSSKQQYTLPRPLEKPRNRTVRGQQTEVSKPQLVPKAQGSRGDGRLSPAIGQKPFSRQQGGIGGLGRWNKR